MYQSTPHELYRGFDLMGSETEAWVPVAPVDTRLYVATSWNRLHKETQVGAANTASYAVISFLGMSLAGVLVYALTFKILRADRLCHFPARSHLSNIPTRNTVQSSSESALPDASVVISNHHQGTRAPRP